MPFAKGDVILRHAHRYPEDALIVAVVTPTGTVRAYPLGGGPEYQIPNEEALRFAVVCADEATSIFRARSFQIDDGPVFDGFTDGARWNGWAMPAFTREVATKLVALYGGEFDTERNEFVTIAPDQTEERWPAQTVEDADGEQIGVYRVGAGAWIWREL